MPKGKRRLEGVKKASREKGVASVVVDADAFGDILMVQEDKKPQDSW